MKVKESWSLMNSWPLRKKKFTWLTWQILIQTTSW